jgi:hypothetical protein
MKKGKIEFENGSDKFIPKEEHNIDRMPKIKSNKEWIKSFDNKIILHELFRRAENKDAICVKRTKKEFNKFFKYVEDNVKLGNEILSTFWHIYDEGKIQGLELYCPKCNHNKDGVTLFKGLIAHACDPGCCSTVYCTKCKRVYSLKEDENQIFKNGLLIEKKNKK